MRRRTLVTDVRLTAHPACQGGLIGWVAFTLIGAVRVDGIALRRSLAGDLILSFPERTDGGGRRHPILRPIDDRTRREIERQVLTALRLEE
jgi:DNA-binding cell septation regulator SpoVG